MSDLPGPEKPPEWAPKRPEPGGALDTDQLMQEFRALLGHKSVVSVSTRTRAPGAGGRGVYDGRSGRFLGKRVRDRHKMVVMLAVCGWKNNEIAAAMGYTPARVSVILKSQHPELQETRRQAVERVAQSTTDLTLRIRQAAGPALDKMISLIESEDENVARLSARDILDRAGYAPVKKQFNLDAKVPVEQLGGVLEKINEANEVVMQRDGWVVKTLPRMSERREDVA